MSIADLPLVEQVIESGPRDPVFDGLLLAGPAVIVLLAVLGRSPPTMVLAAGYVAAFLVHVLGKALRG